MADFETLRAQAQAELARRQSAPQSPAAVAQAELQRRAQGAGPKLLGTSGEWRIYEGQNGRLSAVSAGASTTDPLTIARLMQGERFADIQQTQVNRDRIEQSPVAARANEVVRGTPFVGSYIDEAVGAFSPQAGENMRLSTEAMRAENPGQTVGLNVLGGVLGSAPMIAASAPAMISRAAPTIGGRVAQGALGGAVLGGVEGAIYGAGEGQGGERIGNALAGAGVGAGIGGALGAAAPYVAAGVRGLVNAYRRPAESVISKGLGISRGAAAVLRDTTRMDAGSGSALARGGNEAMLADASPSYRTLLDAAAATPGPAGAIAREAVNARTRDASARMTQALDDAFGQPRGEKQIEAEIRQNSAGARSSTYDAAYAAPIDYSSGPGQTIESLMSRVPESAIRKANAMMQAEGAQSQQIMARIENGRVTFERMPDVRQLDYITRALNDVASEADGAGKLGSTTDLGRVYGNLSRAIRAATRNAVPEYGAALDTAADAIGQRNAVNLGYDLMTRSIRREDVAQALHGASRAERIAAGQGVRSYLDELTANVTRTMADPDTSTREGIAALRAMSSRANQEKLRVLLGPRAADRLLGEIDEAATAFELRAAIAENSKTAVRQATQGAIDAQTSGGVIRTLASGEPVNASKRFVQLMTGETPEAQQLRRMGIYQEIADVLVNTRGLRAQRAHTLIRRAIAGEAVTEAQASYIGAVLSGLVSSGALTAGREVLQPQGSSAGGR